MMVITPNGFVNIFQVRNNGNTAEYWKNSEEHPLVVCENVRDDVDSPYYFKGRIEYVGC